jgi:hypothetical protein
VTILVQTMSENVGPNNEFDQICSYRERPTNIISVHFKYHKKHISKMCICKAQVFNSNLAVYILAIRL